MSTHPFLRKFNKQARETLSSIFLTDVSDPRLQSITITSVDVSPDRSHAKVYYSAPKCEYKEVEEALKKSKAYIRTLMSQRLSWKLTPDLRFYLDMTIDHAQNIAKVIKKHRL
ncbi:MAG: 30S ribosome-binding factor RbfA [Eggerthellaceae bacterium]|nr:30S ribosome-binding factor RbfA [Eggerthellaceae bacterium]